MLRRTFVQTIIGSLCAHRFVTSPSSPTGLPLLGLCVHLEEINDWDVRILEATPGLPIRTDIFWSHVERQKNVYSFAEYATAFKNIDAITPRLLPILGYGNPLYDGGSAPVSGSALQAFGRFAAASVEQFKQNINQWEIYNEPNLPQMWKGSTPDSAAYSRLYDTAVDAIRVEDPQALCVPGGLGDTDWRFWLEASQRSVHGPWTLCALHPYRRAAPETLQADVNDLGRAMQQPPQVWITEWGYSRLWQPLYDDEDLAALLHRAYWSAALAGVQRLYWYQFGTSNPEVPISGRGFDLVDRSNRKPTAAWNAFVQLSGLTRRYNHIERLTSTRSVYRIALSSALEHDEILVTIVPSGERVGDIAERHIEARWGRLTHMSGDVLLGAQQAGAVIYHYQ